MIKVLEGRIGAWGRAPCTKMEGGERHVEKKTNLNAEALNLDPEGRKKKREPLGKEGEVNAGRGAAMFLGRNCRVKRRLVS